MHAYQHLLRDMSVEAADDFAGARTGDQQIANQRIEQILAEANEPALTIVRRLPTCRPPRWDPRRHLPTAGCCRGPTYWAASSVSMPITPATR